MLEARDVTFAYPAAAPVLEGVSLAIAPGERVALSAPSGRGKTTLCQLLAGYLVPTGGHVRVDGTPLPARGICPVQMVWQHPEQVLDPRMRMADALVEAGRVEERIIAGLNIEQCWMRRFPHELSGGEMQRFCIAHALAAHPRYLIADEVSTMLDAVTQAQLWGFLMHEVEEQGMGLLFVSHSPALTRRVATRVVELV